jgi:hypothetical protein
MAKSIIENNVPLVSNAEEDCQYRNRDGKNLDIKKRQHVIAADLGERMPDSF